VFLCGDRPHQAQPYSYDLRKKVIEAIGQDGMKKIEVSQLLNISRNTINLSLKRQAVTAIMSTMYFNLVIWSTSNESSRLSNSIP
jgi:orotate phosphoribosyltransferase-like protein